jgi:hypothetical protein
MSAVNSQRFSMLKSDTGSVVPGNLLDGSTIFFWPFSPVKEYGIEHSSDK